MTVSSQFELKLVREIDAPVEHLYRAWTEPDILQEWFCPKPWFVKDVKLDPRPGGLSEMIMCGPDGEEFPNFGIFLEVIPNRLIVMTDAYTHGWVPAAKPFMTGIIQFEDLGGGRSLYTAIARHWNEEDMKAHEEMGFHEGWGKATDQLVELARRL